MKKRLISFAFAALTITCMVGQRMPANLQKLLNAEYAINALYVDSVDEKKLVEDAIVTPLSPPLRKPRNWKNHFRVNFPALAYSTT